MHHGGDLLLGLVMALNFRILGTTRMAVCIRTAAFQGLLVSALPLVSGGAIGWRIVAVAVAAAAIKGLAIPVLLLRALRGTRIRREMEPFVGYVPSLLLCGLATVLAVVGAARLPLAPGGTGSLVPAASIAMAATGFLVLTTRRKALTQVVGYLLLENGVFVFGVLLLEAMPFLVEVGALLDILVAVLVMGIVVDHIRNEFSSLDTEQLSALRG